LPWPRSLRSSAAIGAVLSLASLPVHLTLSHPLSVQLAGTILAMTGAIYFGLGLQKGSVRQIVVEIVVAFAILAAAMGGMWISPWLIPAAYVAHGAWDFAHHRDSRLAEIPAWYPPLCSVFDWVFAAGITVIWGSIREG
jgi:hypothetical protein